MKEADELLKQYEDALLATKSISAPYYEIQAACERLKELRSGLCELVGLGLTRRAVSAPEGTCDGATLTTSPPGEPVFLKPKPKPEPEPKPKRKYGVHQVGVMLRILSGRCNAEDLDPCDIENLHWDVGATGRPDW